VLLFIVAAGVAIVILALVYGFTFKSSKGRNIGLATIVIAHIALIIYLLYFY
jgi:hypothetical protein